MSGVEVLTMNQTAEVRSCGVAAESSWHGRKLLHAVRVIAIYLAASTGIGALVVANGGGCIVSTVPSTSCNEEGQPANATLQRMYDDVNAYRVANGLAALKYSPKLEAAAGAQARDMYDRHFFDHTNPDGNGPTERAKAQGTCLVYIGENLAMWVGGPDDVQVAWQGSQTHNANMLETHWTYVGMGHFDPASVGGSGSPYWVQVFGG